MIAAIPDLFRDPFAEHSRARFTRHIDLLGARVHFETNSRELLRLVDLAYADLPRYRLGGRSPELRLGLELTAAGGNGTRAAPPRFGMLSGAGLLGSAPGGSTFVTLSPHERAGLVAVAPGMLRFPYHIRYELIEFAVFTLAARVLGLVSLHGACVGRGGRGVLLMGPSGAGKSTVTLQSLLRGLDFLSEDSVFVTPDTLLAAGVPNFLHVRADSLEWVPRREAAGIRASEVIRRRSGVRKYELDLRGGRYRLAQRSLRICAIVFLSARGAGGRPGLTRLRTAEAMARIAKEQVYAASQPPWAQFARNVARVPCFELRRGQHPADSVELLRRLIAGPSQATHRQRAP